MAEEEANFVFEPAFKVKIQIENAETGMSMTGMCDFPENIPKEIAEKRILLLTKSMLDNVYESEKNDE